MYKECNFDPKEAAARNKFQIEETGVVNVFEKIIEENRVTDGEIVWYQSKDFRSNNSQLMLVFDGDNNGYPPIIDRAIYRALVAEVVDDNTVDLSFCFVKKEDCERDKEYGGFYISKEKYQVVYGLKASETKIPIDKNNCAENVEKCLAEVRQISAYRFRNSVQQGGT